MLEKSANLPGPGQVHLWKIDHSTMTTSHLVLCDMLNSQEKGRAQRFVFDHHRRAFVRNRAALKFILSRYRDCAPHPRDLELVCNQYGKPALTTTPELQFNISHSADKALVAVSSNAPVGVDCEAIATGVPLLEIAGSQFSGAAYAKLIALPKCEIAGVFFQYWTRREAAVKAAGLGFSLDIKKLCFNQDEACSTEGFELRIPHFSCTPLVIRDCQSFPGFRASVARERGLKEVIYFSLNEL